MGDGAKASVAGGGYQVAGSYLSALQAFPVAAGRHGTAWVQPLAGGSGGGGGGGVSGAIGGGGGGGGGRLPRRFVGTISGTIGIAGPRR
jgi:hypothetical protein